MTVNGRIDINITHDGFVEATVTMTDSDYDLVAGAAAQDFKLSWCQVSNRANRGMVKHNVQRRLHLGTVGTADFPADQVMFYSAKVLTRPKTGWLRWPRYRRLLGTAAVENIVPAYDARETTHRRIAVATRLPLAPNPQTALVQNMA